MSHWPQLTLTRRDMAIKPGPPLTPATPPTAGMEQHNAPSIHQVSFSWEPAFTTPPRGSSPAEIRYPVATLQATHIHKTPSIKRTPRANGGSLSSCPSSSWCWSGSLCLTTGGTSGALSTAHAGNGGKFGDHHGYGRSPGGYGFRSQNVRAPKMPIETGTAPTLEVTRVHGKTRTISTPKLRGTAGRRNGLTPINPRIQSGRPRRFLESKGISSWVTCNLNWQYSAHHWS
ncbi:hypothetical protein H4V95_000352 [Arthrobacter sp. CAN_C5]|nr:hypothetical protein [Arthrobacter sp. CAN_C5]